MSRLKLLLVLILGILGNGAISKADDHLNDAWRRINSWRRPMPEVKVLNGRDISVDGIKCRLLGVRVPNDPKKASQAHAFLATYMEYCKGKYTIINFRNPVMSDDSFALVWLKGRSNEAGAQEAMVQAGLLEVEIDKHDQYHFDVLTKNGPSDFDWKKCLREADAWHKEGKPPYVRFPLPATN